MERPRRFWLAASLLALLAPLPLAQENDLVEWILSVTRAQPAEERWRSIRWLDSLTEAFERAGEEGKPVFFFGADGILQSGNC